MRSQHRRLGSPEKLRARKPRRRRSRRRCRRRLSYDGPRQCLPGCRRHRPRPSAGVAVAVALARGSPCPRSVRSVRCATTASRSATSPRSSPRRTTSSRRASAARLLARHPTNVVRLDLPSDGAGRRAGRSLPAGGPDPRGVALRRDASQGPAPVDLRLRAGVPRARHRHGADPARVLRPAAARGLRAGVPACCPHERTLDGPARGPVSAAAGDGREHQPGRRALRGPVRRRRAAILATIAAGRPASTSSTTTASGTGSGSPQPTGDAERARRPRSSPPPARSPSRSPTATTATRRRFATATSGG